MNAIRTGRRGIPTELYSIFGHATQTQELKIPPYSPDIYSDLPSAAASLRSFNTRCVPWSAQR
jgi:hypothetical protein